MAAPTVFNIVVDNGDGTKSTITLPITTTSGDPQIALTQAAAITRAGFWNATQTVFYPPSAIVSITPA